MVHVAYDVKELLKACPVKIESVSFCSPHLFASCIDGSLRIYKTRAKGGGGDDDDYEEDQEADMGQTGEDQKKMKNRKEERPVIAAIRKTDTITFHKTLIGFSKKPITSMTVIESKNFVITLSDAIVIHKLPSLDVMAYLSSTKGSSLYAWNEKQGLLCAARQKRLFIFQYDGRRGFVELPELSAPDYVVSMAWCGDSLCLGIRREYVIVNTASGVVTDVFQCGPMAPPLVLPLANGEVLLGKDNAGVFVGQNGKSTLPGGISWSDVPSLVVLNPPYALAWLSRSIEIRYLLPPFGLVQTIFLRDMQLLPTGNHVVAIGPQVIIASDHTVHALLLVPLGAQIVQLTASRKFEEALALCKLLPPEDAALRANKEDDIHRRYGQFLFEQKEYGDSMQQFAASSVDLLTVLSLFPSIKLPNFCSNRSHSPLSIDSNDNDPFDDFSQSAGFYEEPERELGSELNLERERIASTSALTSYLSKKRVAIVDKAEAEDTTAALAAIVNDKDSAGETKSSKSYTKVITSTRRENETNYNPKELAIILDTALVQAQLLSGQPSAALELLTGLNFCDVDTCEEMMNQGSYVKELLQLYKYNELHCKVLELLNQLAMDKNSATYSELSTYQVGPEDIMDYLKKLGGQDVFLVLESSVWLLKTCPERAMSVYTSINPPLPSDTVNIYLKENFPHLQAMYLEHLMENDKIKISSALQNELVGLYLQQVLAEQSKAQDEGSWDEHQHTEARTKLLFILENCTGYNCENVLKSLPSNGFYEERAILLGQLGQHQLALTLYAHKLHEPTLALKYCDKVFMAANSVPRLSNTNTMAAKNLMDKAALSVYLTLLRVYLKPTASLREYDRSVASLDISKRFPAQRRVTPQRTKGHVSSKIAQIEGWDDSRQSISSESTIESGKSDGEDNNLQQTFATSTEILERSDYDNEGVMLDEALDLLSHRWDRIDVGQALSLLPSDTNLQGLYPFLQPLVLKSSETRRNLSVIKNLRQSESLQVKQELENSRRHMVKITNENTCSICTKKIGASVFVMYPSGVLVHFVCHKNQKANRTFTRPAVTIY